MRRSCLEVRCLVRQLAPQPGRLAVVHRQAGRPKEIEQAILQPSSIDSDAAMGALQNVRQSFEHVAVVHGMLWLATDEPVYHRMELCGSCDLDSGVTRSVSRRYGAG